MASRLARRRRKIQAITFAVGLVLALGAMWTAQRRMAFLDGALRHEGIVVDMIGSHRSDPTWTPVVRWHDADGEHDTRGNYASDPPAFELGERVGVYARPGEPEGAVLDSTLSLWAWPITFGTLAAPFLLFGGATWLRDALAARRRERARRTGQAVMAAFVRVEAGNVFTGGAQARRIVAEWTDPTTGATHQLRSEDLGFDPTPWAKQRGLLDAHVVSTDPRVHWVDISFLPEVDGTR
jgi:hypothetical protein